MKIRNLVFSVVSMMLFCVGCGRIQEFIPKEEPAYIEVKVESSVFEERYYYSLLSIEEQQIYQELYQGLLDHEEHIIVHSMDANQVNQIFISVIYDYPQLFWVDGNAKSISYEETFFEKGYTALEPKYVYSVEERALREKQIEVVVESFKESIPEEYGIYEKIKYTYDYLVDTVSYVEGAPDNQNIYSALVSKQSVCAGYAKANQYLLNELGIFCTYVTGTARNDEKTENHAWNIVKCDEDFYYVDVTWADPPATSEETKSERIYDYLLCSETELMDTHTVADEYEYPQCNSEELNYYRLNNMYYESVDGEVILDAMKASIDAKEASTTFKFSDAALYEAGKTLIEDELAEKGAKYLGSVYYLRKIYYSYVENENVNRITVYWQYE